MSNDRIFREYPKMLYQLADEKDTCDVIVVEGRTLKYKTVASADEQLRATGWSTTTDKALKKKRLRHWAHVRLNPWWDKWEWAFKLLAATLVIIAATIKLFY